MTPGSNETKIDQTPTPSRQAHRGVGGRCALKRENPVEKLQPTALNECSAGYCRIIKDDRDDHARLWGKTGDSGEGPLNN